MEEISLVLKEIQNEITRQNQKMNELQLNITNDINNNINEKFKEIDMKYNNLTYKLEQQEKKIEFLERQNRRKNIVVFGVTDDDRNYLHLQSKIINIISNTMKITCLESDIEDIRRIGKKQRNPRPVIVSFQTMGKKLEVLKNKKSLLDTKYNINEDFPKQILEKRKMLQSELRQLREDGKFAVLKYDKIVIFNNHESQKEFSKKRALSGSPGSYTQKPQRPKVNREPVRKTKNNITNFFSPRNENLPPEPTIYTLEESITNK